MPSLLHIVAACTDLKSAEPLPRHRLRAHPAGPDRASRWLDALRAPGNDRVRAADLYVGNHWTVCLDTPNEARSVGWSDASLWVASAGYGLLSAERSVASYSATFTNGQPDSVTRAPARGLASKARRAWWASLVAGRASIASLVRDGGYLLFVGSPAYVDAAHDDLLAAVEAARRPARQVIVVTSEYPGGALDENVVLATGAMRTDLGGPMTSVNARLAHRLIGTLNPKLWSVESCRVVAGEVENNAPEIEIPDRTPMTDEAIRSFVRKELRRGTAGSATRLLRVLRDRGRACEQKRFGRLFREVSSSWAAPAE